MHERGRGKEAVHDRQCNAASAALSHQVAPALRDRVVDRQDAPGKPLWQIVGKPGGQCRAPTAVLQQCDAAAKLGDRGHADERAILVDRIKPCQDFRRRCRPLNLRQHVGVEQQIHGISSRGASCTRSSSRSAPRSGEASRNSASVPLRAGLARPFLGGNDHRIGLAVTGDDLRAGLGAVDHLGQPCLGVGKRPRVSVGSVSGAVLCSVMRIRTNMTIMTIMVQRLTIQAHDCCSNRSPQLPICAAFAHLKSSAFTSFRLSFILLSFFGVI